MLKHVVAAAAGCVALALSGSAAAEVPPQIAFRLNYQANLHLPGRGCPNADEFGLILAGEFGYLLVRDDAAATLRIETRTNGKGIEAELSAPNPTGEGEWRRVITSGDCRELLYDAATLIRIRFGPGGWQGEEPPPWLLAPPRFEVESPELRMVVPAAFMESMAGGEPSSAPLSPWEGTAPLWAQPAPAQEPEKPPFQAEVALGATVMPYGMPRVAVGGGGMLGVRWKSFAFGMDIRGVITPVAGVGEPELKDARASLFTVGFLPCVGVRFVDICGAINATIIGLDAPPPIVVSASDGFSMGFGGRLVGRYPLSSRFILFGYGDVSGQLRAITIRGPLDGDSTNIVTHWRSPYLRVALGLGVAVSLME
ncbi:hypothetical protein [Polyangium jinanense]|uniref:Uncharacterized protein n=1 Tax=Polyangium jinanense TaxID=2829994 RepID=A0A9X3X3U6_9BACT|nr:hypothetical protein [Polyangium jinanense]MDC3955845.1 hypothetical protein [Polyangium jinanense]MDC3983204.1 hypothetical protein [Polyangium jinanense]